MQIYIIIRLIQGSIQCLKRVRRPCKFTVCSPTKNNKRCPMLDLCPVQHNPKATSYGKALMLDIAIFVDRSLGLVRDSRGMQNKSNTHPSLTLSFFSSTLSANSKAPPGSGTLRGWQSTCSSLPLILSQVFWCDMSSTTRTSIMLFQTWYFRNKPGWYVIEP